MTLFHAATKSCTNFSVDVAACIDLGKGPEFGVRTEDKVDKGGGPLQLARLVVAPLEYASDRGGCHCVSCRAD